MAFFRRKNSRKRHEPSQTATVATTTTNNIINRPHHNNNNTATLIRNSSNTPIKTPPGYNKNLRDWARYLLGGCTVCMIVGHPNTALIFSIAAIITMYHGTIQSIKNVTWSIMVWISFPACLWSVILRLMVKDVDEDRAYGLVIFLKILGRGTELFFGCFSGVILLLTAIGKISDQEI